MNKPHPLIIERTLLDVGEQDDGRPPAVSQQVLDHVFARVIPAAYKNMIGRLHGSESSVTARASRSNGRCQLGNEPPKDADAEYHQDRANRFADRRLRVQIPVTHRRRRNHRPPDAVADGAIFFHETEEASTD